MADKLPARFTSEPAARKHLEAIQWPNGPICPHCGVTDNASRIKGGRKGLWFCNACREQFSVTVGTIFESSHLPLNVWLYATHLLCSSKKGISSHQLSRMLGVSYKTAWFLSHRIRAAMAPASDAVPLGGEGKIVEADEMFIGTKAGRKKAPGAGGYAHKRAIVSLVERGGKVRSVPVEKASAAEIRPVIEDNVAPKTRVFTDGAQHYRFMPMSLHASVDHSAGEYARGEVHTNTVEGVFSIFRRGMVGTYQHCGEQHLHRYLAEFDFRYSNRAKLGIDDAARADIALKGAAGKRLMYRAVKEA